MKILVINAGSSSLKYQLINMEDREVLAKGLCERIGPAGNITHRCPGKEPYRADIPFPTHDEALAEAIRLLTDPEWGVISCVDEIAAVGHRIAHGAEKLKTSVIVTDEVISHLESLVPINPLHGPAGIKGVVGCRKIMPNVPQVAVFDTAFYAQMPPKSYIYALPYELYTEKGIRRYGFHGTSHRYVSNRVAQLVGKPYEELKIITCHLGNGSSITAVKNGVAVDTTMGFTPQEGVPMGTRSGTIDPTIITHLINSYGMTGEEVEDIINRKSGLLGVSGISNDCRTIAEAAANGNERAKLAFEIMTLSIKKIIGSYAAEMNGLDVLVFTAGIGENQSDIRSMVCEDMDFLGVKIDPELNLRRGQELNISAPDARVQTWIVPTDEEYMIALDAKQLIEQ